MPHDGDDGDAVQSLERKTAAVNGCGRCQQNVTDVDGCCYVDATTIIVDDGYDVAAVAAVAAHDDDDCDARGDDDDGDSAFLDRSHVLDLIRTV